MYYRYILQQIPNYQKNKHSKIKNTIAHREIGNHLFFTLASVKRSDVIVRIPTTVYNIALASSYRGQKRLTYTDEL